MDLNVATQGIIIAEIHLVTGFPTLHKGLTTDSNILLAKLITNGRKLAIVGIVFKPKFTCAFIQDQVPWVLFCVHSHHQKTQCLRASIIPGICIGRVRLALQVPSLVHGCKEVRTTGVKVPVTKVTIHSDATTRSRRCGVHVSCAA